MVNQTLPQVNIPIEVNVKTLASFDMITVLVKIVDGLSDIRRITEEQRQICTDHINGIISTLQPSPRKITGEGSKEFPIAEFAKINTMVGEKSK